MQPAGREALRVEVEVAPHVVDEADGVGLVVDRERRPVAEHGRLAAQDARAHRVEGRHPHALARPGRRARRRAAFISPAALLVNVIAARPNGDTRCSAIRNAMRCVSTRVLPDPAPAMTTIGPSGADAASRWTGLRPCEHRVRRDHSRIVRVFGSRRAARRCSVARRCRAGSSSSLVGSGSSRHARSSRVWSALRATVNAPAASISSPK